MEVVICGLLYIVWTGRIFSGTRQDSLSRFIMNCGLFVCMFCRGGGPATMSVPPAETVNESIVPTSLYIICSVWSVFRSERLPCTTLPVRRLISQKNDTMRDFSPTWKVSRRDMQSSV
jgi:hypothetical protein